MSASSLSHKSHRIRSFFQAVTFLLGLIHNNRPFLFLGLLRVNIVLLGVMRSIGGPRHTSTPTFNYFWARCKGHLFNIAFYFFGWNHGFGIQFQKLLSRRLCTPIRKYGCFRLRIFIDGLLVTATYHKGILNFNLFARHSTLHQRLHCGLIVLIRDLTHNSPACFNSTEYIGIGEVLLTMLGPFDPARVPWDLRRSDPEPHQSLLLLRDQLPFLYWFLYWSLLYGLDVVGWVLDYLLFHILVQVH